MIFYVTLCSRNVSMTKNWEIDGNLVTLGEQLGEGTFGEVYKGVMTSSINANRKKIVNQTGGFAVAVKMLHGELYCVLVWNLKIRLELMNKCR